MLLAIVGGILSFVYGEKIVSYFRVLKHASWMHCFSAQYVEE